MSDVDRLRRLLDGDVDHSELATDPMLASIAERTYGISVKPIAVSKPSQVTPTDDFSAAPAPQGETIDLMVEVVAGSAPPPMPIGDELPPPLPKPAKKSGFLGKTLFLLLLAEIANLFGAFGLLFGYICSEPAASAGTCPEGGATRINLLSINNLDSGLGWSEPIQNGFFGIPDVVLIGGILFLLIVAKLRK